MRRDIVLISLNRAATVALSAVVVVAAVALSGCGADDGTSASSSSAPSVSSSVTSAVPREAAMRNAPAAASAGASATLTGLPADPAADDPITQNMQASLAADSRQVAPVMHYAPGDGANDNTASN